MADLPALWMELEAALSRLLLGLPALPAHDRGEVCRFIDHNEFGLALETLVGAITQVGLPLENAQRAEIANLAYFMGSPRPATGEPAPVWHVAVVDADLTVFDAVATTLVPLGYRVSWAPTFEAADDLWRSDPADAYLIEVLPCWAVDDIAQHVEHSATNPHPAILALGQEGAGSIGKPLDPMVLARTLYSAIHSRTG